MRFIFITLIVFQITTDLCGQDIRFSQYYQAPIYLNPAFTGAAGAARVGFNFRQQGTQEASYRTTSAFGDYYFPDLYLSLGVLFVQDVDEYSGFKSTTIALPLSYDFSINKNIVIKPGLQASYSRQGLDLSNFLFADQINANGDITQGSAEPIALVDQIQFADVAAGVMAFGQNWWFGYAMHNLLNNNISFVSGSDQPLEVRYSLHGGYDIPLEKRRSRNRPRKSFMPTFNFISQGAFNQLDVGGLLYVDPLVLGLMYRGVPNPLYEGDYTALSGVIGIKKFGLNMGYSYDWPLNASTKTGGIHEISMSFSYDLANPNATPRSLKRLKCPLF